MRFLCDKPKQNLNEMKELSVFHAAALSWTATRVPSTVQYHLYLTIDHYLASTTYAGPTSRCTTGALHCTEGCALLTVLLTVLRSAGPGGRARLRGHQRGGRWVGRGVGAGARYAWLGLGLGLGLGLR